MHSIQVPISAFDCDFIAAIDFQITSRGARATWDDPGYPPEWEVASVELSLDLPNSPPLFHPIPEILVNAIAEDPRVVEAIQAACVEHAPGRYY